MNNPLGGDATLCYPAPLASHSEVVANQELFYTAYVSLLAHLGMHRLSNLRIVNIEGRKDVDLHQLYKSVTKYGGLKIVNEKKLWFTLLRELSFELRASANIGKARLIYYKVLHHFEQLYLHQRQGPLVLAPALDFVAMHQLEQ